MNEVSIRMALDDHFRQSVFAMLEKCMERISELETQVCNLNEKYLGVKKHEKEITDTERLDFMENKKIRVGYYETSVKSVNIWNFDSKVDKYGKTLRQAIDSAMRGNNDQQD